MFYDTGPETVKSLTLVTLAGIGGALSYIWRTTKAGKKVQFFRVALSSCLVAFICFHLGFIYMELGLSDRMIWALNGFSAVIGVETMMVIVSKLVLKFLKVDEDGIVIKELIESGWTPPACGPVSGLEQLKKGKSGTPKEPGNPD